MPVFGQMTERARVLIGDLFAGNTSLDLRNELSCILLTWDVEAANPSTASAFTSMTTASTSTNNKRKKQPLTLDE